MKKKGFTLIELLAVIVVLAIIALIATPIILNIVNNAKKGAAKSSVLGYIDAVEKSISIGKVDSNKGITIPNKNSLSIENEEDALMLGRISLKGTYPDFVSLNFEKGKIKTGSFCMNGYSFDYDSTGVKEVKSNYCANASVKSVEITNKKLEYSIGDKIKLDILVDSADQDYTVTYSSSNELVATVSETGEVTPLSSGEVIIVVKAGFKTANIKLKIYGWHIVVDANNNKNADVGDEIAYGSEHFYVISNDGTNVRALAKYNLLVGNQYDGSTLKALTNSTGKQDASAIGVHFEDPTAKTLKVKYPSVGVTNFNTSVYWPTTSRASIDMANSENVIYPYLVNYKKNLGNQVDEITLINSAEISNLGCNAARNTCIYSSYKWVYSTSYWVRADYANGCIYEIYVTGAVECTSGINNSTLFGVRPVIQIKKSLLS